ncbi:MAG: TlpA family protein disulfide reductase [Marinifilaceae bacterium]
MMKQTFLLLLLSTLFLSAIAKNRVIEHPSCDYHANIKFDRVEITDSVTICDITVSDIPHNCYMIPTSMFLKEEGGDRTYKLLRSEGYELDKKQFMPEEGFMKARLFFERVDDDVILLNTGGNARPNLETYRLSLQKAKDAIPTQWLGSWMTADGINKVKLILTEKKAIYQNKIWDYKEVQGNSKQLRIALINKDLNHVLALKQDKNNAIRIHEHRQDKGTLCSKEFTTLDTPQAWSFDNNRYRNKLYSDKPTVLRGYIEGYVLEMGYTTLTFNIDKQETDENVTVITEIDKDGCFEVQLQLGIPQYVYCDAISAYLCPGDTVAVCGKQFDPSWCESGIAVMSSGVSGEIMVYEQHLDKMFRALDYTQSMYMKASKKLETTLAGKQQIFKFMEELDQRLPAVVNQYYIDDLTRDVLYSNYQAGYFVSLFELYSGYNNSRFTYKETKKGMERILDPNFQPIDKNAYFDFAPRFMQTVMNNPLIASTSKTWVPINRYEYSAFHFSLYDAEQELAKQLRFDIMNRLFPNLKSEIADTSRARFDSWTENGYYGGECDTTLNKYIQPINEVLNKEKDNMLTKSNVIAFMNERREKLTGPSVLWDLAVSRTIYDIMTRHSISKGELLGYVAALLPAISTDYIREVILQKYTDYVLSQQSVVSNNASNSKADSVFAALIKPYEDNVLFIDFWSTGCGPCRAGMKAQRETVEKLKDRNVKFLYVTSEKDSPLEQYNKFLTENDIKGEQLRVSADTWNYLSSKFGISGIPHHVIVNRKGEVVDNNIKLWDEYKLTQLEQAN